MDIYKGGSVLMLPPLDPACGGIIYGGNTPIVYDPNVYFPGALPDIIMGSCCQNSVASGNAIHWQQQLRQYCSPVPPLLGGVRFTVETDYPAFPHIACAVPMGGLWRVRYGAAGTLPNGSSVMNAASSSILVHEMGHIVWWNATATGSWNGNDVAAINEGVADTFAMFVTAQRYIGQDIFGPMTGALRDGENTRQYAAFDPAGDEHDQGELLMGAFWKIRQNLVASYGATQGESLARSLFLDWLLLFDDVDLDSRIMAHLLILDDDDFDLTNGTPHLGAIVGGFHAHGFPAADPLLFSGSANPILGAVFFDPQPSPVTLRASKLSVFLLSSPPVAGLPVFAVAGTPGVTPIPGVGILALDLAMPYYFLIDGLGGPALFPVTQATTDAFGVFGLRQDVTAFWAQPQGIPFALQTAVIDLTAPAGIRLSNGITLFTP